MTKTIGQFYFSFIGPLTITIEITYRTLGITGLTNKYDIFSVLLVKPVILRRNPQCPRHSYLHPQASITISKVDSIPLGCRWSRNMLDQFHFNSIPPQKKTIESTNYHYFAKVFVTSRTSLLLGGCYTPFTKGLPSQIGSQTWSAPASSRSFTTFMWPGFWWNALMDHFHREKRENHEILCTLWLWLT